MSKPDLSNGISQSQWPTLEAYYVAQIGQIHIPEDPKPFDITSINSKLESLFHEARLDYYYITRAHDKIDNSFRQLKRALYPIAQKGKNAEEREHLLQDHLVHTPLAKIDPAILSALGLQPLNANIYHLHDMSKDRVEFLKTVLDMIQDKTSRLITDSGAMKIESQMAR